MKKLEIYSEGGSIFLKEEGRVEIVLLFLYKHDFVRELSILSPSIAYYLDDTLRPEEALNPDVVGYSICYNAFWNNWYYKAEYLETSKKVFKSLKVVQEVLNVINLSADVDRWVKEVKELNKKEIND